MTYEQQVRAAGNVVEALVAIGRGIDEILARPAAADDFMAWPAQTVPTQPQTQGVTDLIAQIDAALKDETDPEECLALEARRRLLTDTGTSVVTELPDNQVRPEVTVSEAGVTVTVPPPDTLTREKRYDLAMGWDLSRFCNQLTREAGAEAYAKGGPIWLHAYDRAAVIEMPLEWRKQMVHDLEATNVAVAQEFARDVLKHGEGVSMDVALELQDQVRG